MKQTPTRTKWIIGLIAVIAIGAIVVIAIPRGDTSAASLTAAQVAQVKRATLIAAIESAGSIEPNEALSLNFTGLGTVTQIHVKVGDQVKAGEVLAQLDTAALELELQQAQQALLIQQANYQQTLSPDPATVTATQAALASAQAAYAAALQQNGLNAQQVTVNCANETQAKNALDHAQVAYDRLAHDHQARNYLNGDWGPYQAVVKQLSDAQAAYAVAQANCNLAKGNLNDGAIASAQSQVAQAKANLDDLLAPSTATLAAAKAQLEQARLNVQAAQLKLTEAEIVAPSAGIVTQLKGGSGEASASVSIGLADTSQYHINVLVDETEIAKVQPGQPVVATLDGLPGVTLSGQVAQIDPSGALVQGVINYNVRIELAPSTAPLRLYLTTNVRIIQDTHADVLVVPLSALHTDPASEQPYVTVVDQTGSHRVNVTLGLMEGAQVEVAGDLKEGDQVLITATSRRTTNPFNG